jgi:predicted SAM-dependent methyltransferase
MIETITFKDRIYPRFQSQGYAAQFAIPFAKHICKGEGYDIGCNREEWKLPGARGIDLCFNDGYHATNLPDKEVDFIFSSHCLEHLDNWVQVLEYWKTKLKSGGVLFLYLPHYDQEYWRPWHNTKHKSIFLPSFLRDYMSDSGFTNVFVSEKDLNSAFIAIGEKI